MLIISMSESSVGEGASLVKLLTPRTSDAVKSLSYRMLPRRGRQLDGSGVVQEAVTVLRQAIKLRDFFPSLQKPIMGLVPEELSGREIKRLYNVAAIAGGAGAVVVPSG